jgi:hypothetical protein
VKSEKRKVTGVWKQVAVTTITMAITIIFIICAMFFIVCSLPLAFWVYMVVSTAIESRSWPYTMGAVTGSGIIRNRDCNGLPGYHYSVGVEYKVNGQEYYVMELRLGSFRYFSQAGAKRVIEKYPIGQSVKVFYDPDYPDCSLLQPGFSWECFYPLLVFGSVLSIGLTFLALVLVRFFA